MKRMFICLITGIMLAGCATTDKGPAAPGGEKERIQVERTVVLETTQGEIEIKLYPDIAPKACENFTALIGEGYYDGVVFHRIIKGFMIQGGDPTGTGRGGTSKWGRPFEDEVSRSVVFDGPGILAMANSGKDSNGSQFFITVAPAPWLNMKHTIFGKVIAGEDTLKRLENIKTGAGDRPVEKQEIIRAYVKT
jgi:peptidylprolyl isomerase